MVVGDLARAGWVVALDEFQHFNREKLREFCSLLQREIDTLSADAARVPGGLLVLGSIHTEISALLEDRSAPLYNRTTDDFSLDHLDIEALVEMLEAHSTPSAERLLFLWNLFEGVPKFYRDCFEQGVLDAERAPLLKRVFFLSSSPLRNEADNWFLKELHGRYDVVLKHIARHPGCTHGDLIAAVRQSSAETDEQVGGYLKVLSERYRLIEKRLPIFAKSNARKTRYYIVDNFLRSWLGGLASPAAALHFRPLEEIIADADGRLTDLEGFSQEKLVATLYEERSRKRLGDFSLTARIEGYWDRSDTELDLVALSSEDRRIRFATSKRNADKLLNDLSNFEGHVARFLDAFPRYKEWKVERVAIAPRLSPQARSVIEQRGLIAESIEELIQPFRRQTEAAPS